MIRVSICFLILCFPGFLFGQGSMPYGSRSMAMANASVTNTDVWSYHNNPGALADIKEIQIGISYENRFLSKEMQSQALAAVIPLKNGVISIGGNGFGYSQLRTYKVGAGYSMKLSEFINAGLQLNYQTVRINPVYGNGHGITAELGFITTLNNKAKLGLCITNIGRTISSTYQYDRYSTCMRMGLSYAFSEEVLINSEIEKDIEHPLRFKAGIEYNPISNFFLRGGFASEPIELSFGFGYCLKKQFFFNSGFSFHNILGWSPNFSFEYEF